MLRKKKKPTEHDHLTKEIKAEVRKEKIHALFHKHKINIFGLLAILAILALIILAFNVYQKNKETKYSQILQQILTDAKQDSKGGSLALKKLYEDKSAPAGVRSLASLKYAAILLNEQKTDQAVGVYLEINKSKKYDNYIKELAGLLALKSMIDSNDKIYQDKIINLAGDLEKNSKTLKYYVVEQKAVFEWNRGNHKIAGSIFKDLYENPKTPQAMKNRAKEMNEIYNSNYGEQEPIGNSVSKDPQSKK